jgi:flagellar biosynthesis anti-sigma factor FlgM
VSPAGSVGRVSRVTGPRKKEAPAPVSEAADVELSASLQEIDRAREALAILPDVRVEKVEGVKPLVDDGSYKVESEVLAKRIVDTSLRESAQLKKTGKK